MIHNLNTSMQEVKPLLATAAAAASSASQVAIWMDVIKGWAALITVVIGVPTAIMIMVYWAVKAKKAWLHRNDDTSV